MRWHPLPFACLLLVGGKGAFLPSPHMARAGSSSYKVATGVRARASRSPSPGTRTCLSSTSRRDCHRIRGGWGVGWSRRRPDKSHSSTSLSLQPRDDDDTNIRGGALPNKAGHTDALDMFSGPIKLQVTDASVAARAQLLSLSQR